MKADKSQALLIIDQCSRVFFDRTLPTDDRPEVMDLFAEGIGTVVCHRNKLFTCLKLADRNRPIILP
jgi:hypothetical protein